MPALPPAPSHRLRRRSTRAALLLGALGVLVGASGCTAAADPTPSSTVPVSAVAAPSPSPAPTTASAAPATPATPSAITVEELGRGEQQAEVDVEVDGPAQVAFRRITIAPGAGTGLHCHDGQLVAVVEKGVLTHYAPVYPGGVHEYQAGDSIVEGAHYVHEGKNEGTEDVVLLVSYVIEAGQPLAETDLTKCDPR